MRAETTGEEIVLHVPAEGEPIGTGQDALDVIGEAWGVEATVISIPAARFVPGFFDLRTGLAGEFIQKMVNYRQRLAVIGDISAHVAASDALGAFVRESNRGTQVWFLESHNALTERLTAG
ncbi:DUF4180 domain-containing protein [Georgenia subflava]|uniref:DUF4180 domain-containing protein n=1 Tax=Georgenia subflava TaxID=1622177 RepID=A0A6N7EKX3_9MICO|nr:DUF4180 domain-containing protein [Georgenia subflava]MPV37683.1 DUF4180 domain-containing protein [Georgenia subflava]